MSDKLTTSLQENLLVLLAYSDEWAGVIRNSIEPNLFTSAVYRDIVSRCFDYIDHFKSPPKQHLPDLLDDVLATKTGSMYVQVIEAIEKVRPTINEKYVLTSLEKFVRQQQLKIGVIKAGALIQEGKLDQAEEQLERAMKARLSSINAGMSLADVIKTLGKEDERRNAFRTGIPELDKYHLGPARKELHLYIGPPKSGKTWWLINLTKYALANRARVVYITLEVKDLIIGYRVIQALLSMTAAESSRVSVTYLERDELGRLSAFNRERLRRPALITEDGLVEARRKLKKFGFTNNLRIKSFPTGSLTVHGIHAYLDALERVEKFVPDLLLIDYADLMKIGSDNYRIDLGNTYKDLRGLADERNLALATASQSNRVGAQAKLVLSEHAAEDYSKIATADIILTYSQTQAESMLNLARLFVAGGRTERDHFAVMITQAYALGQFALDSAMMLDSYWSKIKESSGQDPFTEE